MNQNYTYAVARIRALESRMLGPLHVQRMIEAPGLDQAFFVLHETSYGEHISGAAFDYDAILQKELEAVYSFLNSQAADDPALLILWRMYDYANTKLLIRKFKLGIEEGADDLAPFGTVDLVRLTQFILKGEGSLPEWLEKRVTAAIVAFEETKNPAASDDILDKAFVDDLVASKNSLLVKLGLLWREYDRPFNKAAEDKAVDILRVTKRHAFGVEVLITFWLAKYLETKTIRQILIGKRHRIENELIRERVRVSYV